MKTIVRWSLIMTAALLLTACPRQSNPPATASTTQADTPPETAAVMVARPRLIEVGAKACQACQQMAPVIDALTTEMAGQLDVEFLDVSITDNVARAQAMGIASIPTQVFLDADGQELWRHTGFISQDDILAKWRELGHDFADAATPLRTSRQ